MKKSLVLGLALAMGISVVASASPAVTSNVPVDSNYYRVLDKLEGLSYIYTSMPATKPYSRLYMAKLVQQAELNRQYREIPEYLRKDFEALKADLKDELAALENENVQISNFKVREAGLKFVGISNNQMYQHKSANAYLQPMNANNNGHYYGDGGNGIFTLNASGSLSKDVALGLAGRFSYDKDNKSKTSLEEGYVKTHLGVWGIELGKQALQWGGADHNGAFAFGRNATPHTMAKLSLLEDHEFNNGFLRFLGKGNINVFYSEMEGNRKTLFDKGWIAGKNTERDDLKLIGIRADIKPNDHWTIGLERVSIVDKISKDWFTGHNAENAAEEHVNDIAGIDTRIVMPGVQFYASAYGDDQAGHLPSRCGFAGGIYFPQLAKDGSWDLRLEGMTTHKQYYSHFVYKNGWSYKGGLMGNFMGGDARKLAATLGHYMKDGSALYLDVSALNVDRSKMDAKDKELTLTYSKPLGDNVDLETILGYAKLEQAGKTENMKMIAVGTKWKF